MRALTLALTLLAAAATALPACAGEGHKHDHDDHAHGHDHGHDHSPKHGGVVVEAGDIDYELVVRADTIALHLRGHDGAVDLANASATLTLLSGRDKQSVELKPVGDRLEATGSFPTGPDRKAVAVVRRAGQSSAVRFTLE